MGIAVKLKNLCRIRGVSYEDIAERTGVSLPTVNRWAAGAWPRLNEAMKLADALGVTLNELTATGGSGLTDAERRVLDLARRVGLDRAEDRLLNLPERDETARVGNRLAADDRSPHTPDPRGRKSG